MPTNHSLEDFLQKNNQTVTSSPSLSSQLKTDSTAEPLFNIVYVTHKSTSLCQKCNSAATSYWLDEGQLFCDTCKIW